MWGSSLIVDSNGAWKHTYQPKLEVNLVITGSSQPLLYDWEPAGRIAIEDMFKQWNGLDERYIVPGIIGHQLVMILERNGVKP